MTVKTVKIYRSDSKGFYKSEGMAQLDSAGNVLMPADSTQVKPALKEGYWYKLNASKKWDAVKKPTTCKEAIEDNLTVISNAPDKHSYEVKSLLQALVANESDVYRLTTDQETRVMSIELIPETTFEEVKAEKLQELASKTKTLSSDDCKEMYVTSSLGVVIDADGTARNNLLGLITTYTNPVTFRLRDNTYLQDVTLEQLETMQKECYLNGQNLYAQKWQFEQQIEACTTKEEIEAVSLDFVMMDFSGKAGA